MTEKELYIKCVPQIAEVALEIQKMTKRQYLEFKRDYLEEVSRTCPKALGFVQKVLATIEWSIEG